ncbi:MAG: hypothetical protein E6J91_31060 [Deltaproteobacteria bacterium]|nr:MAG: hypothetical protein E6J91_31060 [Deltaproteobacteria bacterium]
MKPTLILIAMISIGCGIDTAAPALDPGSTGSSDPGGSDPGTGPVTEVSGHVTAATTWKDRIHVVGSVTIDAGVTVTVQAGTTVDVASNAGVGISVLGVLDIRGTRAAKVTFRPATAGETWSDISVPRGGAMTASYLVQTGGGIALSSTGKVTLVDSQMSHAGGDFLTMSGGTLNMTYSAIGLELGQSDTTHCDMHVSGPVTITASHSNFSTAAFGLMFYGGTNADFTYTNWFGNADFDVATEAAYPVTGNFSNSYFAHGAPSYAGFTVNNMASARVADAGVR